MNLILWKKREYNSLTYFPLLSNTYLPLCYTPISWGFLLSHFYTSYILLWINISNQILRSWSTCTKLSPLCSLYLCSDKLGSAWQMQINWNSRKKIKHPKQRNSFSLFFTDLNGIIAVNYHMSDNKQSEENMKTHQTLHHLYCIFVLMKRVPHLLQSFGTVCMCLCACSVHA